MKRPFCVIGFSFAAAMYAAFSLDGMKAVYVSAAAALTGAAFYLAGGKRFLVVLVACFSTAAAFGGYSLYYYRNIAPFENALGQVVTIEGIVTSMSATMRGTDYIISASFPKVSLPDASISVRMYGEVQAGVGDIIRCRVELQPADGSYYASRGIMAKAVAREDFRHINSGGYAFEQWRLSVRTAFEHNLYAKLRADNAAIIGTMVMNIGEDPSAETFAHTNKSGILHMLSISGLHFSVLSSFVLMVLSRFSLPRRTPEIITILLGFLFVVLAGFSAPITRAFAMFSIAALGRVITRRGDALNSLGTAMLIICVIWPVWTQSTGIWLSALSTLGILLIGQKLSKLLFIRFKGNSKIPDRLIKPVSDAAGITVGAYTFTFPLLALQHGWLSLIAPLTNVLIAPFVTPVLIGGMLCAVIPFEPLPVRLLAAATDFCCDVVMRVSALLAGFPFITVSLDQSYLLIWIGGAAISAALLTVFKADKRLLSYGITFCVLSLSIGGISARAAEKDTVELVTLEKCDVAILLRDHEAVIIGAPDRYDITALTKYLDYRNVSRIACIAAYDMGDNIDSGLARLNVGYEIVSVISPDDYYIADLLAHALKGVPVYTSGYADIEVLGGVLLRFDQFGNIDRITAGGQDIIRLKGQYNPKVNPNFIHLYEDGIYLPDWITPVPEPVGESIYGETRIILRI